MTSTLNIPFKKALLPALIGSALILGGCGSSRDSDDTANGGSVTAGIITGFGSIYVNGIKFETDQANFDVDDDESASQDDLRVGMRVKINGRINDDGLSGTAQDVIYENELEGPVSSIDASDPQNVVITILGQTILVNADTTFDNDDNDLSLDSIALDDVLEVSGYTSSSGLIATHIELQDENFIADVTELEIKGQIEHLVADAFTINGLAVRFDSSTELEDIPGNELMEGYYVEVKGTLNAAGDLLSANSIEAEDDDLGDDVDEVELEGLISDYDEIAHTFSVQGQQVDASQSPELMPSTLTLANDLRVEVEGSLMDGILIAQEIKLKGRKIKLQAPVSAISLNPIDSSDGTLSFSLFGGSDNISVRVNQQTEMEDDMGDDDFMLNELMVDDYVEIEAYDDGTPVINAIELKRKEQDDIQIEAPISGFDAVLLTVSMFGQTFDISQAKLEGEEGDDEIDAQTFFGAPLSIGSFVELSDEKPSENEDPDGIIDKAEIEEEDDD